jgi:peptide/nickel transport system substrate-binding protein
MKLKSIIMLILITLIIFGLAGTIMLSAQTNVPSPRDIPGTVKAKRPIQYEKGRYGGNFIDALTQDPKSFNETQASDAYTSSIIAMTAPSLFDLDIDTGDWNVYLGDHRKGETGPGYTIEVLDNGEMHVTVYLRRDIFWTDGSPLRADDWVYYFNNVICNIDIAHPVYGATWIELPNGDEEQTYMKKIDKLTFKKIYPRSLGDPEISTNLNIMPKHIIEPVMNSGGAEGLMQIWGIDTSVKDLVGYGPWIIEKFEASQAVILRRNDRYFEKDEWGARIPYMESITYSIAADQNAVMLKFKAGELDMLSSDHFPQNNFKSIVDDKERLDYTVWNGGPEMSNFFLTFNQNPNADRMKGSPKLEWFQNKNFRYAINHLIDRETIVAQAYNGLAEPSDTLLIKSSPYYEKGNTFDNSYSPKKAMQYFDKMGIRDRNGDGILEDSANRNIGFELITYNDLSTTNAVVANLVKEWNANGIEAILSQVDFNTLINITGNTQDWEATIFAITSSIFPVGVNVWPSDGNLHVWYPNQTSPATDWEESIDKIHRSAQYEPDFELRKEYWNEMYEILYEQLPLIPLVRRYKFMAVYNIWGNTAWDIYGGFGDNYMVKLYKR